MEITCILSGSLVSMTWHVFILCMRMRAVGGNVLMKLLRTADEEYACSLWVWAQGAVKEMLSRASRLHVAQDWDW
jgi:hypothetical protein